MSDSPLPFPAAGVVDPDDVCDTCTGSGACPCWACTRHLERGERAHRCDDCDGSGRRV